MSGLFGLMVWRVWGGGLGSGFRGEVRDEGLGGWGGAVSGRFGLMARRCLRGLGCCA